MHIRATGIALLGLILSIATPGKAQAAESFDACKSYITALPATISAPGTYCLKQNLAMSTPTGTGINITANDVVLDCNDAFLDNSGAGVGTKVVGVRAVNVSNTTVRHCNIRGFEYGIYIYGTKGANLVEDNHLDGNTYSAMIVQGDGSVVRHNVVVDTGGSSIIAGAHGIYTGYSVDVLDNTVSGVFANGGDTFGIRTSLNASGTVSGNRVRDVLKSSNGIAQGIANNNSSRVTLTGNTVSGNGSADSVGLQCSSSNGRAKNNVLVGFARPIVQCGDAGGNDIAP